MVSTGKGATRDTRVRGHPSSRRVRQAVPCADASGVHTTELNRTAAAVDQAGVVSSTRPQSHPWARVVPE